MSDVLDFFVSLCLTRIW